LRTNPLSSLFRRGSAGERDEPDRRRVERLVQWLRWLAVGSWAWLIQSVQEPHDPKLLYSVYGVMVLYAAVCEVLVRRARRIGVVSVLTTLADTFAVFLMCLVSGGVRSPVFPVFFLSVLATTIRFGTAEAFLIASLDTLHAVVLYAIVGDARLFTLAENVFYIYFVALLGGLLSGEAKRQHRHAVAERERASLLLALNRQIVASSELSELLSRILAQTCAVVSASGACVVLRRVEDGRAERVVATGRIEPPAGEDADALLRFAAAAGPVADELPLLSTTAEIARQVPSAWIARQPPSRLAIARIGGAAPLGALGFFFAEAAGTPSEETLRLLGAVAEETAVAVQKARLGAELVEAQAHGRELLHRVIDAEEAERRRIAGELHDRMGKRFFEFYYDVRLLQGMSVDRDSAASEVLARIIESARECAGEIRTLMNDLRPSVLDDFGFLEALKEFVAAITARGELDVALSVDETAPSAGPETDLMLFRVLQEAVFNARKHAAAKRVDVTFGATDDGKLRLVVRDDGAGFEPASPAIGHYGLLYMKERAEACGGAFAVRSVPRQGTEVEVTVPIPR
jgi:signal transduction histidine kinase